MKKTAIIYGQLENDLQKRALEELTKILLDYIGSTADLQDYINDFVGIVGQQNKQDGTDAQLNGIFCFRAKAKGEVLEQVPDPEQQD